MKTQPLEKQSIASIAIGEIASLQLLAAQVGLDNFAGMKRAIQSSVYWPEFVKEAKAGQIAESWLPGMIGKVVLGWAKATA